MTGSENKGRAVHTVYLNFSKAFDTVSHNILIEKGMKCRLGKWIVRWIQNWLNSWAQGIMISGTVQLEASH